MENIIAPEKLDAIIEKCGKGKEAAIPLLQAVQDEVGYVPREAMDYMVEHTNIDAVQLYGVVTFYTQFRLNPVGRHIIKVCHGTACHVAGADAITGAVRDELKLSGDIDTTEDLAFTVEDVACLGCCSLAPVVMIDDISHGKLTPDSVRKVIREYQKKDKESGGQK
jgi:NADH:ubiquinone oxidoreductase subunit E